MRLCKIFLLDFYLYVIVRIEVLKNKCYIAIFVTAIAYTGWHISSFTIVREIDRLSVFSEGSIALMLLVSIYILQSVQKSKSFYMLLMPGFTFLFIAFWTDTLDEIYNNSASGVKTITIDDGPVTLDTADAMALQIDSDFT